MGVIWGLYETYNRALFDGQEDINTARGGSGEGKGRVRARARARARGG